MRSPFEITNVRTHVSPPTDKILGLLCFASCQVGPFSLDSLQVRRSLQGRYFVLWPTHKDVYGIEHLYFEIADETIRAAVHTAVNVAVLARAHQDGILQ
jgi:hypothetical protein